MKNNRNSEDGVKGKNEKYRRMNRSRKEMLATRRENMTTMDRLRVKGGR